MEKCVPKQYANMLPCGKIGVLDGGMQGWRGWRAWKFAWFTIRWWWSTPLRLVDVWFLATIRSITEQNIHLNNKYTWIDDNYFMNQSQIAYNDHQHANTCVRPINHRGRPPPHGQPSAHQMHELEAAHHRQRHLTWPATTCRGGRPMAMPAA